jgi:hypothetical protein
MRGYMAVLIGPAEQRFGVGPFVTSSAAAQYGTSRDSEIVTYTGHTGRMMLPNTFDRWVGGQELRMQEATPERGQWIGEITRCIRGADHGFITSAEGISWFFSRNYHDGHDPDALAVGMRVIFTGSPHPSEGKRYPRALAIRALV